MARRPRQRFRSGKSGIEIDTTGVRAQVALMRKLGVRGADARPAYDDIEAVLRAQGEKQWATTGHGEWPKLAASTQAYKNTHGGDQRIMRASGALYKSLTQKAPRARWRRARKTELRWGTKLYYAFFHQEGHGVPQRKVIDIDPEGSKQIAKVLGSYITYGECGRARGNTRGFGG
jgi:hypothetical protein